MISLGFLLAALQSFWLDHIAEWLLVRPTRSLAQDLQAFDAKVVNRIIGLPSPSRTISSLASWEARRHELVGSDSDDGWLPLLAEHGTLAAAPVFLLGLKTGIYGL